MVRLIDLLRHSTGIYGNNMPINFTDFSQIPVQSSGITDIFGSYLKGYEGARLPQKLRQEEEQRRLANQLLGLQGENYAIQNRYLPQEKEQGLRKGEVDIGQVLALTKHLLSQTTGQNISNEEAAYNLKYNRAIRDTVLGALTGKGPQHQERLGGYPSNDNYQGYSQAQAPVSINSSGTGMPTQMSMSEASNEPVVDMNRQVGMSESPRPQSMSIEQAMELQKSRDREALARSLMTQGQPNYASDGAMVPAHEAQPTINQEMIQTYQQPIQRPQNPDGWQTIPGKQDQNLLAADSLMENSPLTIPELKKLFPYIGEKTEADLATGELVKIKTYPSGRMDIQSVDFGRGARRNESLKGLGASDAKAAERSIAANETRFQRLIALKNSEKIIKENPKIIKDIVGPYQRPITYYFGNQKSQEILGALEVEYGHILKAAAESIKGQFTGKHQDFINQMKPNTTDPIGIILGKQKYLIEFEELMYHRDKTISRLIDEGYTANQAASFADESSNFLELEKKAKEDLKEQKEPKVKVVKSNGAAIWIPESKREAFEEDKRNGNI